MATDESDQRGKCVNCGFLVMHHDPFKAGPHFTELENVRRERGNFFHIHHGPSDNRSADPICLRAVMSFQEEMDETAWDCRHRPPPSPGEESQSWKEALRVINKDRQCPKWSKYQQGLPPSVFLAVCMISELEESLEKNRREWEQSMEKDRRTWESRLDEDNQNRSHRANKIMVWLVIAGLVFALAEIFAAVVAVTPDSLGGKWFRMNDSQVETSKSGD